MRGIVCAAVLLGLALGFVPAGVADGRVAAVRADQLALMPLPKGEIGREAQLLPLDRDSGVQSNVEDARGGPPSVTPAKLKSLGRLTGYSLDYNDAALQALAARHGLIEVQTQVDLFKSPTAARAGFAFAKRVENDTAYLKPSVDVSVSYFAVPTVGTAAFGSAGVARIKGKAPIYGVDIDFVEGPLLAQIAVSAADVSDRRGLGVALARKLERRIRDVLAGRIAGPPVPLPAKLKAGPPPSGLDLSALTLSAGDVGGGRVKQQGYRLDKDLNPLSEYQRQLVPAGRFPYLLEQVAFFPSATAASFTFSILAATLSSTKALSASAGGHAVASHLVKIPIKVGDEARATRVTIRLESGQPVFEAYVVFRVGVTTEFIVIASPTTAPITSFAVQLIAASAGRRATLGLHHG